MTFRKLADVLIRRRQIELIRVVKAVAARPRSTLHIGELHRQRRSVEGRRDPVHRSRERIALQRIPPHRLLERDPADHPLEDCREHVDGGHALLHHRRPDAAFLFAQGVDGNSHFFRKALSRLRRRLRGRARNLLRLVVEALGQTGGDERQSPRSCERLEVLLRSGQALPGHLLVEEGFHPFQGWLLEGRGQLFGPDFEDEVHGWASSA